MKITHYCKNKSSVKSTIVIIATFLIIVLSACANAAENQLEKILKHKIEQERLSVGVAIATVEDGKVSFINVGVLDKKSNKQIDENTLFEIGSVSKTLTSLALASYVTEGELELTDNIQPYLPKLVSLPVNNKPITFESLANHHSGLPRLPSNLPMGDPLNPYADYTKTMLFDYLNTFEPTREVGATPEYSNLGSGLLGVVLANINKSTYEHMLKARVLIPLKMENTYIDVPDSQLSNFSKGHNSNLTETKYWQLPALAGAGGIISSSKDMSLFLMANMNNSPLNKSIKLTHKTTADFGNPSTKIGLAWIRQLGEGSEILMHNGQTGGFASFIGFNPSKQKGIVILSNTSITMDDIGYAYLTDKLDSINLVSPVTVAPEKLDKLLGEYELMQGFSLTVTRVNDQLFVQGTGQPKLPLTALSSSVFVNHSVKARITFNFNEQVESNALILNQGGQELKGIKVE